MIRFAALLAPLLAFPLAAQDVPPAKPAWMERLEKASASKESWEARRKEIREQILVAAGLWPEFERPALKPVIFHLLEREGYSVEKVRLETLPGFHLTGNLYRPLGKKGPFPAVVSPHGHWGPGRFEDSKDCSIPGRSLTMARMGMLVFTYDMVGYGDLKQLPHQFSDTASGVGLLGLQLWNSLRAVDFVSSLPDVDPKRIGATGASGGGTQTFLLGAVDDRVTCAVPVNMVAAEFQGGCSCENAPVLRIGLNNVEIAAAMAPRPLMLVACTGDWTKDNPKLEAPAIQRAFAALGVEERFRCVQFNYGHNYNKDSREAVYAWMGRWLNGAPDAMSVPEPDFKAEKREDLAVFDPGHPAPPGTADAAGVAKALQEMVRAQLDALRPRDGESLKRFRELMAPALAHTFSARWPAPGEVEPLVESYEPGLSRLFLRPRGTTTPLEILQRDPPAKARGGRVTLLAVPRDREADPMVAALLRRDEAAVVLSLGAHRGEAAAGGVKQQRMAYGTTFFRTPLAWQVQDVLVALARLDARPDVKEIHLAGLGDAGPAVLLARALAKSGKIARTTVDATALDRVAAQPGAPRIDAARSAAILAAPGLLVLHGVPAGTDLEPVRAAYRAAGREEALLSLATGFDRLLEDK